MFSKYYIIQRRYLSILASFIILISQFLCSYFLHSVCLLSPVPGSFVCGVHTDHGCEVSVWRFTADLVTVLQFYRSPASAHYGSFLVTIVTFYTAEPHNYLLPIGTHGDKGWKMSQHPQNYFNIQEVCCLNKTTTFYHHWKQDTFGSCVNFNIEDLYLTVDCSNVCSIFFLLTESTL